MQTSPFWGSAFPAQIPGLCAPMWALGPLSGHVFGASLVNFFFVFFGRFATRVSAWNGFVKAVARCLLQVAGVLGVPVHVWGLGFRV